MPDYPDVGKYSLKLGGDWDLQDLSVFRQYLHVYSVMYALQVGPYQDESRTRTFHAFEAFPWKGGWSAVDFYEGLRHATPDSRRPRIVSIQFSSPGFIELMLLVPVSAAIRVVVDNACRSFERISATYTTLHKDAAERKLLKSNARTAEQIIGRRDLEFCESATSQMADLIGLEHMRELHLLTNNPLARMKIMFSLWRKIRELAKAQDSEKVKF